MCLEARYSCWFEKPLTKEWTSTRKTLIDTDFRMQIVCFWTIISLTYICSIIVYTHTHWPLHHQKTCMNFCHLWWYWSPWQSLHPCLVWWVSPEIFGSLALYNRFLKRKLVCKENKNQLHSVKKYYEQYGTYNKINPFMTTLNYSLPNLLMPSGSDSCSSPCRLKEHYALQLYKLN